MGKLKELRKNRVEELTSRTWNYDRLQFKSVLPTPRIEQEAERMSREVFYESVNKGEKTTNQLLDFADQKGLLERTKTRYGSDLDDEENRLRREIFLTQEDLERLAPQSIDITTLKTTDNWSKIIELSQKLQTFRQNLVGISLSQQEVTGGSAESQSDNMKQLYLLRACTYVDTREDLTIGEPQWEQAWDTMDDLLDEPDRTLVTLARVELEYLMRGMRTDRESLYAQFPERRVLQDVGIVNSL